MIMHEYDGGNHGEQDTFPEQIKESRLMDNWIEHQLPSGLLHTPKTTALPKSLPA